MTIIQLEQADIIEKDVLPTLLFSAKDVLESSPERQIRQRDAHRAMALGNNYQGKLDIYFMTADGKSHRVYTTVWASTDEHLNLKSGACLPIRAVTGFDFY